MRTRGLASRSGFASLFCLCVAVFSGLQRRLGTPPSLPAFARLAETKDAFDLENKGWFKSYSLSLNLDKFQIQTTHK
jgi:hypothetical protein